MRARNFVDVKLYHTCAVFTPPIIAKTHISRGQEVTMLVYLLYLSIGLSVLYLLSLRRTYCLKDKHVLVSESD